VFYSCYTRYSVDYRSGPRVRLYARYREPPSGIRGFLDVPQGTGTPDGTRQHRCRYRRFFVFVSEQLRAVLFPPVALFPVRTVGRAGLVTVVITCFCFFFVEKYKSSRTKRGAGGGRRNYVSANTCERAAFYYPRECAAPGRKPFVCVRRVYRKRKAIRLIGNVIFIFRIYYGRFDIYGRVETRTHNRPLTSETLRSSRSKHTPTPTPGTDRVESAT